MAEKTTNVQKMDVALNKKKECHLDKKSHAREVEEGWKAKGWGFKFEYNRKVTIAESDCVDEGE